MHISKPTITLSVSHLNAVRLLATGKSFCNRVTGSSARYSRTLRDFQSPYILTSCNGSPSLLKYVALPRLKLWQVILPWMPHFFTNDFSRWENFSYERGFPDFKSKNRGPFFGTLHSDKYTFSQRTGHNIEPGDSTTGIRRTRSLNWIVFDELILTIIP